jgi:type I restriction enzyme S subunit
MSGDTALSGKYTAYPEYKDSGVDWFGDIPSHWRVAGFKKYIKSLVDYRGKTPNKTDDGVLLVTARNIKSGSLDYSLSQEFIAEEDYDDVMSRGKPSIGDLLFTTEAPLGEVSNIDRTDIALAQRIIKFCGKEGVLDNYYFKYLIMSEEFQQSLYLFASGSTVKGIKAERFVYLRKLLPSIEEQEKIVNFLEHETAQIDTLIEKQQQLIKLLKEKRQAVISHAVTKGLNLNAPMCDSSVEWLGEVPENWAVAQLKFNTLQMQTGPFGSQLHAEDYVIGGVPLINPAHMIEGNLSPDPKVTVDDETQERLKRHKLSEGEIIFARRGELGRCAIVTKDQNGWLCGTGSLKAKLNKKLIPEYAYLLITSDGVVSELSLESKGSTMDNLNTETLGRVRMPVPPRNEQNEILEYVENISGKYKHLINSAVTAINLIQERRTALISAAVTGKIDVRNWQAPKPATQGAINV